MPTFPALAPITTVLDQVAGSVHVVASERDDVVVTVLPANPGKSADAHQAQETSVDFANGVLTVGNDRTLKNWVIGPKGAVSIVPSASDGKDQLEDVSDSADIDRHTKTDAIQYHHAEVGPDKNFVRKDEIFNMTDEPNHQDLSDREQAFFLKAIQEDLDLTETMDEAVNSLRIVLAAEQSINEKRVVELA